MGPDLQQPTPCLVNDIQLSQLIDLSAVQKMAEAHYQAAGMPIGIIDARDGSVLVGVGWQDICVKFHRANPVSRQRCQESDSYINTNLVAGQACGYKCKNGLWDIGIPIIVAGQHLATMFLGQFFYEGETPQREMFIRQAGELGFDTDAYLAALDQVPVLPREKVEYILEYNRALVGFITDLAEQSLSRIQAEHALRREKELTDTALDSLVDTFFLLDPISKKAIRWNRSFRETVGYTEAEIAALPVPDSYCSPATMERVEPFIKEVLERGSGTIEVEVICKDGRVIPTEYRVAVVPAEPGSPTHFIAIGTGIQERRQAEEALRAGKAFVDRLLDAIPIPVFYKNRAGRYLGFNRAFEQFFGERKEDLIGKTVFDVNPPELAELYHSKDTELFEAGGTQVYEASILNAAGEARDVIFSKAVFTDGNGAVDGLIGTVLDLTKLRQAEHSLRAREAFLKRVLEQSPFATWISDTDGTLRYANPALLRFLNITEEQIVGRYNVLQDPVVKRQGLEPLIRTVYEQGETVSFACDWDGSDYPGLALGDCNRVSIEATMFPIHNPEGELTNVVLIWIDVTDRKRTEQEKERLEAQLRQAVKMEAIGTLAGGIAHDFNNLLTPILGNTELAKLTAGSDSPLHKNLDQVLQAGHRAKELVKQILTFSRQADLRPDSIDLAPIVAESLQLLRSTLPRTITIKQHLTSEPCTVLADPTQLQQIVMNLATNAGQAMAADGGLLEVTMEHADTDEDGAAGFADLSAGRYVRLSIRDTGGGIEPELMDKIFDPFFTTKPTGQGTGMGLAVVHGIVQSHGGAIVVDNDPGQGATFHVLLQRVEKARVTESQRVPQQLPRGTEHILFVDDEQALVMLGQRVLQRLGYQVETRTSSIEALTTFKDNPDRFDLVITDMTMPDMTGEILARRLLELRPDIPIIICTGFSHQMDEAKALALGIRALVMKPFVMRDVAEVIRSVLDAEASGTGIATAGRASPA